MADYGYSRRRRSTRLERQQRNISLDKSYLLNRVIKFSFFGLISLILIIPLLFFWYSRDLPTPGKLVTSKHPDATRIYDRKGELLYSVYQDQNRTYIKLADIPKYLQQGTIAIEDKDFYKNQGFSPIGYLRVVKNFLLGQGLAGASTISQQLVKVALLEDARRTPSRKIKELILSIQVNQTYSKDQIFEMYLNNIPYGGTAVGVEAAAETYFGKKAGELDLAESAFLAGLPQSPTVYSPFSGNKYYVARTKSVLRQMVADDYITQKEADKALVKIENYKFSQHDTQIKAPHFVLYVKELLAKQFGDEALQSGGLQVKTTLDYEIQKRAEEILKEEIDKLKGYNVHNGAVMITDPTNGEILAMVGSKDYFDTENDGNFNVAVQGKRQPGSSLKPVIYAKSFEKGYTPATLLLNTKTNFTTGTNDEPDYFPVNYDGKFTGPVQVRFALGNSFNIPAVKMLSQVGIKDAMQKAYEMGIQNWNPTDENLKTVGYSLVLGGRETTLFDEMTAYGVFANRGKRQDLVAVLNVKDNRDKTIFEEKKKDGLQVLSEEVAFLISHILLDNNARSDAFGTNSYLRIPGKTVSVKTGTTDEKRDNWTLGYTPSYVVGVWVGNNDNSAMNQKIASGVTGASPVWNRLMTLVLRGKQDEQFPKPDNVVALQIDSFSGGLPLDGQPARTEYFIKGTEPTSKSPIYKNKDGKDYWVFHEEDPISQDGKNRWQEGIDAWIQETHKEEEKYNPPDELKNWKKGDSTPTPGSDSSTPTPE